MSSLIGSRMEVIAEIWSVNIPTQQNHKARLYNPDAVPTFWCRKYVSVAHSQHRKSTHFIRHKLLNIWNGNLFSRSTQITPQFKSFVRR